MATELVRNIISECVQEQQANDKATPTPTPTPLTPAPESDRGWALFKLKWDVQRELKGLLKDTTDTKLDELKLLIDKMAPVSDCSVIGIILEEIFNQKDFLTVAPDFFKVVCEHDPII